MIVDSASIPDRPGETIGFDSTGAIYVNDALVAHVALPLEPDHEPWYDKALRPRIHVAHNGSYAAIANDYGRFGVVFEVATGRTFLNCFRFASRQASPHSSFGLESAGHQRSGPGECLTNRVTSYKQGEAEPSDYLDYFHGRPHVSPDGR